MATEIQKKSKKIASLIIFHLKGIITDEQKKELNNWVKASRINRRIFTDCTSSDFFEKGLLKAYTSSEQHAMVWNRIRKQTIVEQRKRKLFASLRVAAGLLILIGLGVLFRFMYLSFEQQRTYYDFSPGQSRAILELSDGRQVLLEKDSSFTLTSSVGTEIVSSGTSLNYNPVKTEKEEEQQQEKKAIQEEIYNNLKIPRGGEYSITLSDGTRVYLNAESEFRYPENFLGAERKVYLKGEAYFEVKHLSDKPFVVDVSGVETTVLGTSFNTRSYPEEETIMTTLVSGKLNVANQTNAVILHPGQQAVVQNTDQEISVMEVNTEKYTAWHYGKLIYDNEPLDKILRELSRWYDFELFYEDQGAKQLPFSCNLERYDNLSELLTVLEKTRKIKFSIHKESVVVETL